MSIEDFTPRHVGDTGNPLTVTFTDHIIDPTTGTTTPYNLTGLVGTAFKLYLKDMGTQVERVGLGTWSVVNAVAGIAQYAWNPADVASAGTFGIRETVLFSSGLVTFETRIIQLLP